MLRLSMLWKWRDVLSGWRLGWSRIHADGVTDDTRAIQLRVDAAARGRGTGEGRTTVLLPAGTMAVHRSIRLRGVGTTIRGASFAGYAGGGHSKLYWWKRPFLISEPASSSTGPTCCDRRRSLAVLGRLAWRGKWRPVNERLE